MLVHTNASKCACVCVCACVRVRARHLFVMIFPETACRHISLLICNQTRELAECNFALEKKTVTVETAARLTRLVVSGSNALP